MFKKCLEPTLDKLGLREKPQCIFNVDESGFPLSGRPAHVICKRGVKSPQCIIGGSGRENVTVQVCVNGCGDLLPPYVIFSGKHLMATCTNGGPVGTRYGVSVNGWMTTQAYIDWFKNPTLPDDRPILLILDGHSSHVSYEVRQLAVENNIHMLKLPPHLTHLLQHLDVGVFKPHWYAAVADFTRKEKTPLTKCDFPHVLAIVWKRYNPESAKGGFKGCGIYPFDSEVIPSSSLQYSLSSYFGINDTSSSQQSTSEPAMATTPASHLPSASSATTPSSLHQQSTSATTPSRVRESPVQQHHQLSPHSSSDLDHQPASEPSQRTPSIVDELLGLTPVNNPTPSHSAFEQYYTSQRILWKAAPNVRSEAVCSSNM